MKLVTFLGLLSLIVSGTVCTSSDCPEQAKNLPLVATKYGKLWGVTVPVKETPRTVDAFYRIPFAKPPVGPLRFANPEAPEPWKSIRDASQHPPMCLQYSKINTYSLKYYQSSFKIPPVSEDCLYLNVFTPSDRLKGFKLPVMVVIPGGGLVFWGASYFDGSALSAYEDVVVVSLQYRLGVLGFLSTGDDQLRGNLGLLDQVAALRWVQENIADFGGDPQSVTIFGESAGGICVAAHVLSPLSKGLFHRAIAQSGTATMPALVVSNSEDLVVHQKIVSKFFDCGTSSLLTCLKQKTEKEILAVMQKMEFIPQPICVDGIFLPRPAMEIMANNQSNDVPFLLGVCKQEWGMFLPQLFHVDGLSEGMSRETIHLTLLDLPPMDLNSSVISLVLDEYLAGMTNPFQLRDGFLDIAGDRMFVMPALRAAKSHRDAGHPVYFYEFQHSPSSFAKARPDYAVTDHTDDLVYVFGGAFLRDGIMLASKATDEEKLLTRTVMRYWANFAKTGNPNGPGLAKWPQYDAKEQYLAINVTSNVSTQLKEKKYKFWTEVLRLS